MAPTGELKLNQLDSETRQEICEKLNVPRPLGGDYKTLAGLIRMPNDKIQLAGRKEDPAEQVLAWYETKTSEASISNLRKILLHKKMRREDVVEILDKRLQGI